jgi:hypothetical protein
MHFNALMSCRVTRWFALMTILSFAMSAMAQSSFFNFTNSPQFSQPNGDTRVQF